MCQKWFVPFHAGDLSLDDAPQSGRPDEASSDQIETLIENNERYAMQKIADILKVFKSIKLLVNMKNVTFILWKKITWTFWPTQYNGCCCMTSKDQGQTRGKYVQLLLQILAGFLDL